jgi:site-specific DNA-cytosine methylase
MSSSTSSPKYLIDFFAGFGGFSRGAQLAGLETILAFEYDKTIITTHQIFHPKCKHVCMELGKDEPKVFADKLLTLLDSMNINLDDCHVHLSPSCQQHSYGNPLRDSTDNNESASLLGWSIDLCDILKPKYYSIENVSNCYLLDYSNLYVIGGRKYQIHN